MAAKGLKIFISVDMEGIGGITSWEEMDRDVLRCKELMTEETNAAIRGIRRSGERVDEIRVCDSHSGGQNILIEKLDPAADLIQGSPRPEYMIHSIDRSFDLLMCIGYHARGGHLRAQMDHTYTGWPFQEVRLNGRPMAEYDFNAGVAGERGVPCGLVAGDDTFCAYAKKVTPGVLAVATKVAISRYAARNFPVARVRGELEAKAEEAVLNRRAFRPHRGRFPATLEFKLGDTGMAEAISFIPGTRRRDGQTVAFPGVKNWKDVYGWINVCARVTSSLRKAGG